MVEITSEKNTAGLVVEAKAVLTDASITSPEKIASILCQISGFIEENRPQRLIISFEQVKFFSSQLLGMLLKVRAEMERHVAGDGVRGAGKIVIGGINPQLYRIFKITNLDKIFEFQP